MPGVFLKLWLLNTTSQFEANDGCAESFDANFKQRDNFVRCFGQVLAF